MKHIYLASEINVVAKHIVAKVGDVSKMKAVFINTAGEMEKDKAWMDDNRNGLNEAGVKTFDYTLTGKTAEQIESDLGDCNWIHVNGGNTFYLLLQARKSGFDKFVKKQVEKGVIYSGSSAGSIIASPNIEISRRLESKIYEEELKDFSGFGLVDFIILPHWGSKGFKALYRQERLQHAYKTENRIILLNDFQYVDVESDGRYRIVDIRQD